MSAVDIALDGNDGRRVDVIALASASFVADPAGALYWPQHGLLVVADLHLEKGSSFARRGVFLPPYDSAATLTRLAALVMRYAPRIVVALGDSFHDGDGPGRLSDGDRESLLALQRGRDWIWVAGNHDPDPAPRIGGVFAPLLVLGGVTFRHEPTGGDEPEIAGHLHPVARVPTRARIVRRACFAGDDTRLVMPAFGAYTGGLNVRDRAFAAIFRARSFTAHMLGPDRLYPMPAVYCLPD
ncbi:MAG: ligase-associated DNA damage response endonuclease PdeM [Pseudorhodoplanes sp.]